MACRSVAARARAHGVVAIAQGDIWWAELSDPVGSGPGFRRPVVIVQGDALNQSRLATVVCVPFTSNLRWADAPGSVLLPAAITGLDRDSVANATQIVAIDRGMLSEKVGELPSRELDQILVGVGVVLGS